MTPRRRFWHVAGAGTAFQAGSSAVDSATVMSALVFQLTGSAVAVGAVSTILRLGWLLPQLFVGYFAGRGASSMPFYVVGAFGRTAAIALLASVLWVGANLGWADAILGAATLGLWVLYAFLSGIVGVPYNDIVARSVPSERRSRMLSIRFFGGGVVALGVAALADRLLRTLDFPVSYAAVLGIAAGLMLVSSFIFTAMGEPAQKTPPKAATSFTAYLREGVLTFRRDLVPAASFLRNGVEALFSSPRPFLSSRQTRLAWVWRTWRFCSVPRPSVRSREIRFGAGGAIASGN